MGGSVRDLRVAVQTAVRELDPDVLEVDEAERLLGEFSVMKNSAEAAVTKLAARVLAGGAARRDGAKSDADWLSKKQGTTVGKAKQRLRRAANLKKASKTRKAFEDGELSGEQADAVAGAAAAHPEEEQRLLDLAKAQPLTRLQDEANRVRSRGDDAATRHARIHRDRHWRRWTDGDGARCGHYRMTPELAAVIENAAQPFIDAAFNDARREGRREDPDAYAADGLVAMARAAAGVGDTSKGTMSSTLLVNVESLLRGSVDGDEACEIPGVGPVSVSTALDLLGPDGLKIVIRDGIDIRTVVHFGRHPTAAQRTAIYVRDRGRCVRPTCPRPMTEVDHTKDWSDTHQTCFDDLAGLCDHDHGLKTHRGHTYRRGPNGWEWHRPDGTIEHERPPPDDA